VSDTPVSKEPISQPLFQPATPLTTAEAHIVGPGQTEPVPWFWPLTIVAASVCTFFIWQCTHVLSQRESMLRELGQRQALLGQAQKVDADLKRLVDGLARLAQTDTDAKALMAKYGINAPPPGAAQPVIKKTRPMVPPKP
jgi:hypothetical protein